MKKIIFPLIFVFFIFHLTQAQEQEVDPSLKLNFINKFLNFFFNCQKFLKEPIV